MTLSLEDPNSEESDMGVIIIEACLSIREEPAKRNVRHIFQIVQTVSFQIKVKRSNISFFHHFSEVAPKKKGILQ